MISGFPIENTKGDGQSGGFNFGGEWDAEATVLTENVTTFDDLYNCTFENNALTTTAGNLSAFVRNLSYNNTGTELNFRFTWPDTTTSAFIVGLVESSATDITSLLEDLDTVMCALSTPSGGGAIATMVVKLAGGEMHQDAHSVNTMSVGDVIRVAYRYDIRALSFYNETQGNGLLGQIDTSGKFSNRPSLFIGGYSSPTISCNFDDILGRPLQKDVFTFDYPADLTKTYRVSNANDDSTVKGKKLNNGDFVNFVTDVTDDVIDVVVTHLYTEQDIRRIAIENVMAEINANQEGTLALAIQNMALRAFSSALAGDGDISIGAALDIYMQNNLSTYMEQYSGVQSIIGNYIEASIYGTEYSEIRTAIDTAIDDYATSIGLGATQPYPDVVTAIDSTITYELAADGDIYNAIQAAVNP